MLVVGLHEQRKLPEAQHCKAIAFVAASGMSGECAYIPLESPEPLGRSKEVPEGDRSYEPVRIGNMLAMRGLAADK